MWQEESVATKEGKRHFFSIWMILALLFPLVSIVGGLFYLIFFRIIKWRWNITLLPLSLFFLLITITGLFINPFFNSWLNIYIYFSLYLGLILGFLFICFKAYELKENPALKGIQGWAFEWKYRKSPFQIMRKEKYFKSCKEGKEYREDSAPLGILDGNIQIGDKELEVEQIVRRYYEEAQLHTAITGGTGSGKTITMRNLIETDVRNNITTLVIDFKNDVKFVYYLSKLAKRLNKKFYHFKAGKKGSYNNPFCKYQASYDPLASGNSTSKADMILNMRDWDGAAEVYKHTTLALLQSLFYLLDIMPHKMMPSFPWDKSGFEQFSAILDIPNLKTMLDCLTELNYKGLVDIPEKNLNDLNDIYSLLTTNKDTKWREQLNGLRSICMNLQLSAYGIWLQKDTKHLTPNHIDLFKLSQEKESSIVLFSFSELDNPEFAKFLGSMIVADISRVVGLRSSGYGGLNRMATYIDECQTINPKSMIAILDKARASGVMLTISTQSLDKLVEKAGVNGENVLTGILGTCNNFIIHAGADTDSNMRYQGIIGKTMKKKCKYMGHQNSGFFKSFENFFNRRSANVMINEEEDWILPITELQKIESPNKKNNYKSTMFYITKSCSEDSLSNANQVIARKVHVVVNDLILQDPPKSFIERYTTPKKVKTNVNSKIQTDKKIEKNTKNKEEIFKNNNIANDLFNINNKKVKK